MRKNTIIILAGAILLVSVFSLMCFTEDGSSASVETPISEWYVVESTGINLNTPHTSIKHEYSLESATQPFQIFSIGEKDITGMYLNVPFEGKFSKQQFSFDIKSAEQDVFMHVFGEIMGERLMATEIHFKDASMSSIVSAKCLTYLASTIEGQYPDRLSFIDIDDHYSTGAIAGTIYEYPQGSNPFKLKTTSGSVKMEKVSQTGYLSLVDITIPAGKRGSYDTVTCVVSLYSTGEDDFYYMYGVDDGRTCEGFFTIGKYNILALKLDIDSESKHIHASAYLYKK